MKILLLCIATLSLSCAKPRNVDSVSEAAPPPDNYKNKLRTVLRSAEIPPSISQKILATKENQFMPELLAVLDGSDKYLRTLIDKQHPFNPLNYVPRDLVELTNEGAFRVSKNGMLLRYPAALALEEMARAGHEEGITLLASSTYRSYDYQVEVYDRNVRQSGQETADRESARPGYSQHQLGLVIDFGSITNDYAKTAPGKWLYENASKYGWSLSFPDGYEPITGYRWECWHYRYVGKPLTSFIDKYFGGIQQYALRFIYEWENYPN
ncbi:MAG: M15 family metallopeptidase [Spirochaetaceae bacterium]|nr:M15 family metallopeptidase [Spirochaetaceae bacterium]